MRQHEIIALFDSCQAGDLNISATNPKLLSTLKRLRDVEDRSLLDVSIAYKHRHIFEQLLTADYLVSVSDCLRALKVAVMTQDTAILDTVSTAIYEVNRSHPIPDFDIEYVNGCNTLFEQICTGYRPIGVPHLERQEMLHIVHWFLASAYIPHLDVNRPLMDAWSNGYLDIVRALIDAGANEHLDDNFFASVVRDCVDEWRVECNDGDRQPIIDLLLAYGLSFNFDAGGCLQDLCRGATAPLVKHIVDTTVEVDKENIEFGLIGACQQGNTEVVRMLLDISDERDYDFTTPSGSHQSFNSELFHFALKNGHQEAAEMLFQRLDKRDLRARSSEDEKDDYVASLDTDSEEDEEMMLLPKELSSLQLLRYAVACGSRMIVKKMLRIRRRRGLCVDSSFVFRGDILSPYPCTVLSEASDPEIIKMLLEYHASPNPRNCGTVLRVACQKLQVDSVKTLLKARANAAVSDVGESALFHAVYAVCPDNRVGDQIAIVNLLLDAGADACDVFAGLSVAHLHFTDRSINNAVFDVLLTRCPDLLDYIDDDHGTTVLMVMSMANIMSPRLIQALLDAGADAKATDNTNQTALFHLFSIEDMSHNVGDIREAVIMLLSAGTDPTLCCDDGDTVLMKLLLRWWHPDAALSTWIGDILDSVLLRPREDVVADAVAYLPAAPVAPWQPCQVDEDVESSDDDLRHLRRERFDHVDGEVYSCDDDSRAYKKARR